VTNEKDHVLLGPIKAILEEEMPKGYKAQVELVIGRLTEAQEDNFKVIIYFISSEKDGATDWTWRITQRIHKIYAENVLTSLMMPAAHSRK